MTEELQQRSEVDSLSEELAKMFADSPIFTPEAAAVLRKAADDLDKDPQFYADHLKGKFVSAILAAMQKMHVTKSTLALAWGKSRQYLGKVLDEDKRINFTLETMVQLSMLVNCRMKIDFEEIIDSDSFLRSPASISLLSNQCRTYGLKLSSPHNEYIRNAESLSSREHYGELVEHGVELTA